MTKKSLKFWSVCLTLCMAFSLLAPFKARAATALTDIDNNWAKSYIEQGVKAGWISGYSDGTFRPNGSVTRGAFCKMLNKALGLQTAAAISFSDVKTSNSYYAEIRKAVCAGYISGYSDGTFRSNQSITHQQAAVMIARVITNPTTVKSLSTLSDSSSIATYARSSVQKALSKGYLAVTSSGAFKPAAAQTRADTAKIIASLVNGEKIIHTATTVSASGKTLSNAIYTAPVTISSAATGTTTISNCSLPGSLSVRSNGTVLLKNSSVSSLTVSASGKTAVSASGSSAIVRTYLSTGAALTESGLTGTGFNTVGLSGTALKTQAVTLRGAFTTVTVSKPAKLSLVSGSIASLGVMQAAAGSTFALAAGTSVSSATVNGAAAFTGTGTISSAVQNASGVTFQTKPASLTGTAVTGSTLTPTITPANGAVGVSSMPTIKLTFQTPLYNSAGTVLTAANVASNVVELRKGSTTGTATIYSASVSTDRKTISVTPVSALASNTSYYVIIRAGRLKNSSGVSNSLLTYSFTTQGTLIPTVTPSNGATGVAVGSDITLSFAEAVYTAAGAKLTSAYLSTSSIELHRGSAAGSTVAYTATISSSNQSIVLNPVSDLEGGVTYYLVIKSGSLKNAIGTLNGAQTFSFTTAASVSAISISSGTTNVATVTPSITLRFSESAYLLGATSSIKLTQTSNGIAVPYAITFTNGSRTAILTPTQALSAGTQYTISIPDGTFCNMDGTALNASALSFTTAAAVAAAVTISSVEITSVSATVNFLSTVSGTATVSLTNQVSRSVSVTANVAGSVKFEGLIPGSTYEATIIVRPAGQTSTVSDAKTVTTRVSSVTLTNLITGTTTAMVHIVCDYPGTVTLVCSPTATLSLTQISLANAGSTDVNLSGLQANTSYTVTAILTYSGGSAQGSTSFTAGQTSGGALSSFRIQVPNNPVILYSNPAQILTCSAITVTRGTTISFTAVPSSATATVTMNAYSFTAAAGMTSYTATVTVSNSGSVSTYTFVIPLTVT